MDLTGVRDMPKGESTLELDFSSLLGPLFFEWLMQLLLPVFVFTLVHEKEHSLRIMMKMQGLPDRSASFHLCSTGWTCCLFAHSNHKSLASTNLLLRSAVVLDFLLRI